MKIHLPQFIYLALVFLTLGMTAARQGEYKKPSKHNFWTDLIAFVIIGAILFWGGFFSQP